MFGLINPNTLEKENCTLQFDRIFMLICTEKKISIFNKRNSPLTKLECISNEQGMFTLKNPNLIPRAKGYFNPNPSGLHPSRIWIGHLALGISVWIFQGKHSLLIGFFQSRQYRVSRSKGCKVTVRQTLTTIRPWSHSNPG